MNQDKAARSISIDVWRKLAEEGSAPPVTICLDGDSMRPLIRKGRDPVTIVPLTGEICEGDIVLFRLGGRNIVHRVWKTEAGRIRTFGDNCWNPDPWIPREQVLGRVIKLSRGAKAYRLDGPAARRWGRAWMAVHPVRLCWKRMRALAGRCLRRIIG